MSEIKIPRNNYDIVFKNLTSVFREGGLEALQIDCDEIDMLIDTEQPIIDIQENQMDMVFQLKDKSFLHLEFQTTNKKTDLSRFLIYDARLYEMVRGSVNDEVEIRTIVIYGPNTGNPKKELSVGSFTYNVEHIYLYKMDGETIFNALYEKIESEQPLSDADKVNLILNPLMKIKGQREQRALQTVELASKLKEDRGYIIGAIIGLTNTIVSKEIQQKMLGVFVMTDAFKEIQEQIEEETKRDIRKNDIYYLLDEEYQVEGDTQTLKRDVSKINSFEYLDKIYRFILSTHPKIDELQKKISDLLNISKQKL